MESEVLDPPIENGPSQTRGSTKYKQGKCKADRSGGFENNVKINTHEKVEESQTGATPHSFLEFTATLVVGISHTTGPQPNSQKAGLLQSSVYVQKIDIQFYECKTGYFKAQSS